MLAVLLSGIASAGPSSTLAAFARLDEILELRLEEGVVVREEVLPTILVGAQPIYEESVGVMQARSLEVLVSAFGDRGVRACEACMAPRSVVQDGVMVLQTGPIGLDEVIRLDDMFRGEAQPARSAVWVEEHRRGVAIRIVDLATGRVLFAQNLDPALSEVERSDKRYRMAAELERRARGDGLTHVLFDVAVYPEPHISMDISDQFGRTNANLGGFTLSALDPTIGVGAHYFRRLPINDTLVGAKLIVSMPTSLSRVFDQGNDFDLIDPLLTAVGVVRVPFGRSNFGAVLTASTNGAFGLGLTAMNPLR